MYLTQLEHRADRAGAVFKQEFPPPMQQFPFVGYFFNLLSKTWSLDPSFSHKYSMWITNFMASEDPCQLKLLWSIFGALLWVARVYLVPMSSLLTLRKTMSSYQKLLYHGIFSWDSKVLVPKKLKIEVSCLVTYLVNNPLMSWLQTPTKFPIVTDAHITGGAFLFQNTFVAKAHPCTYPTRDMPFLELRVVLWAARFLSMLGFKGHLVIYTDCLAVVHMINKARAKKPWFDILLQELFKLFLPFTHCSAVHISTNYNPADKFSRMFVNTSPTSVSLWMVGVRL